MQFIQVLSLILGFVFLIGAMPSGPLRMPIRPEQISRRHSAVKQLLSDVAGIEALIIKDFLISDISSSIEPTKETWDLTTNCMFTFQDRSSTANIYSHFHRSQFQHQHILLADLATKQRHQQWSSSRLRSMQGRQQ